MGIGTTKVDGVYSLRFGVSSLTRNVKGTYEIDGIPVDINTLKGPVFDIYVPRASKRPTFRRPNTRGGSPGE